MTLGTLIFRYAFFAVLATVANLATQYVILSYRDTAFWFTGALAVGTLVGLVVKYVLDKRWIFADTSTGAAAHAKKFTLYTVMGVVTTVIFWGTQTTFWLVWETKAMALVGGALGLAVGYVVKYNLDRRFVFTDRVLEPAT